MKKAVVIVLLSAACGGNLHSPRTSSPSRTTIAAVATIAVVALAGAMVGLWFLVDRAEY